MIIISFFLKALILLVSFFLMVAFFTLFERKLMGLAQSRLGPSKVGLKGIGQPFSDVLKLLLKASMTFKNESEVGYFLSPCMMLIISSSIVGTLPFNFFPSWKTSGITIMFLFSVSSLWVILSGWFSNSVYASIGASRSVSQSLSFEVPLSLSLISLFLLIKSFSLEEWEQKSLSLVFILPWMTLVIIFCFLAEAGRSPFDLPESESELVSGFNVEYGGFLFTMIFLSETISMLIICSILSLILFGSCWSWQFILSLFCMTSIRPSFPRIRFDQAMTMAWLVATPLSISAVFLTSLWS